jgi:hypothetical protein
MNKEQIFQYLSEQSSDVWFKLLEDAYDYLSYDDRSDLFGSYEKEAPPTEVEGDDLLLEIQQFDKRSRAGRYYAPFNINSKNYSHIPEETEEWFEELGNYLQDSCQLTAQGDYQEAVACFALLYELIELLREGEEIVFGDEIGTWMIPGDEKQYNTAYFTALAQTATPEAYATVIVPLAKTDSWQSFYGQVYETAVRVANKEQKEKLDAEIQRLHIRTEPKR